MTYAFASITAVKKTCKTIVLAMLPLVFANCELVQGKYGTESGGNRTNASAQDLRRSAAMKVIQAKCFSCHSASGGQSPMPPLDSSDHAWTNSSPAWVVAGSPEDSRLMERIKHAYDGYQFNWGDNSLRDMPQGSARISSAEIKSLIDWIENIQDEDDTGPVDTTTSTTLGGTTTTTLPPTNGSVLLPEDPIRVTRNNNERFRYAMEVLRVKCMSCHATRNDFPSGNNFLNETAWRNSGMIVAGNSSTSRLITKLKRLSDDASLPTGNPLKNLSGNMPQGTLPALSTAEAASIADWIDMIDLPRSQLMVLRPGLNTAAWNPITKPIVGLVGDRLRVRNLDSTTHSIHANNNRPFAHGVSDGGNQRVNFGGAQDFTYINPANSVDATDRIYDHFRSSSNGLQIYFVITRP